MENIVQQLRGSLTRTREFFTRGLKSLTGYGDLNEELLEELEELLIEADVGVSATETILAHIRDMKVTGDNLVAALRDELIAILQESGDSALLIPKDSPAVILVVGVNGTGKTTTVGKLAYRFRKIEGKSVLIAASDTFRAAAIDQLQIWAERAEAEIVAHDPGADPSSVAFDAISTAKARGTEIVIVDTAGRLHTKSNLMEELKKIRRVIGKHSDGTSDKMPHETLLVLDGTTGQNAIVQARRFQEAVPLTGLVITKLDGTSKGGVVAAISQELGIPVKLIGVGEGMEDLRDFDAETYADALLGR